MRTRVTRRSESSPSPQRLETSEYLEQVFDSSEGESAATRSWPVPASVWVQG